MPGAVIVDRSARLGGIATDGALQVAADRTGPLKLTGATVYPRTGAGQLAGDMVLPPEPRSPLPELSPCPIFIHIVPATLALKLRLRDP